MKFIIMILGLIIIIAIVYGILITASIIPIGKCKCGGKYYNYLYDSCIDKMVYKCNKCHKEVI